jgi:hypothetical protein
MIHYFNPGHETAVLNGSKFYQPGAKVRKMQEDLALLPAWYAAPDDYVLLPDGTLVAAEKVCHCGLDGRLVESRNPERSRRGSRETSPEAVDLWGISPQSIYFVEKLSQSSELAVKIPEWKTEYPFLGSRFASRKVLLQLTDTVPEIEKNILPQFFSDIDTVENHVSKSNEKQLVKSPYSSSGRGLVWLPPGKLARSERQIISGMLRKQSQVSIEKALDKRLDFSMHFEINAADETKFIGYSVFQTNSKGAYEKSLLANQTVLEQQITEFVDKELLHKVRNVLTGILHDTYSPYYKGTIGVDMLIYQSDSSYKLNPCVEINMRKSMGYLAVRLFEKYIHPDSQGEFSIEYHPDPKVINQRHADRQRQYPLAHENGRIKSGYLSLCPVTETSNYHAYLVITLMIQ